MMNNELNNLFLQFSHFGPELFCKNLLTLCEILPKTQELQEDILLNYSNETLATARDMEKQTEKINEELLKFSYLLRKVAHQVFRKNNSVSKNPEFLRLV